MQCVGAGRRLRPKERGGGDAWDRMPEWGECGRMAEGSGDKNSRESARMEAGLAWECVEGDGSRPANEAGDQRSGRIDSPSRACERRKQRQRLKQMRLTARPNVTFTGVGSFFGGKSPRNSGVAMAR